MDAERIKRSVSLPEIAGRDTRLEQNGREYKGCCPLHKEKTPSFTLFMGREGWWIYNCFGCGAKGDVISYIQQTRKVGFVEACKMLGGDDLGGVSAPKELPKPVDKYAGITIRDDAPVIAGNSVRVWNPKIDDEGKPVGWKTVRFAHAFLYAPNMVVLRSEYGKKKVTPQIVWADTPGGRGWVYMHFPEPRPLYGMEKDAKQVIVVQGEKKAMELRNALGGRRCVVSACGGDSAVRYTDWSVLAGRDVVIWPDADESGRKAALYVAETVAPTATRVRILRVDDKPQKWDAGDYLKENGAEGVVDFMRERMEDYAPVVAAPAEADPELPPAPPFEAYEAEQMEAPTPAYDPIPLKNPPAPLNDWRARLIWEGKGNARKLAPRSTTNLLLFMRHHENYAGVFRYDGFAKRIIVRQCPPWESEAEFTVRPVQDYDYVRLEAHLEKEIRLKIPANKCREAVASTAQLPENTFNPASEYFASLQWDGVPRLDTWLLDYVSDRKRPMFGEQPQEYLRIVGRKFLCGLAARAMHPGCKFDTMMILEGAQYAGKSYISKLLSTINGVPYFLDDVKDITNKDTLMEIQGKLVVEFAEISAMRRAEINELKGFLSRQVDMFRPPYGVSVIEAKRQCVFIGTVNPEGPYLRDVTGNRRYWPVACRHRLDLQAIAAAVPMLHAEAAHAVRNGEQLWLTQDEYEICCAEQNKRVQQDIWLDMIEGFVDGLSAISTDGLLEKMAIPLERRNNGVYMRLHQTMAVLGWEPARVSMDGKRARGFRKKNTLPVYEPDDIEIPLN